MNTPQNIFCEICLNENVLTKRCTFCGSDICKTCYKMCLGCEKLFCRFCYNSKGILCNKCDQVNVCKHCKRVVILQNVLIVCPYCLSRVHSKCPNGITCFNHEKELK